MLWAISAERTWFGKKGETLYLHDDLKFKFKLLYLIKFLKGILNDQDKIGIRLILQEPEIKEKSLNKFRIVVFEA